MILTQLINTEQLTIVKLAIVVAVAFLLAIVTLKAWLTYIVFCCYRYIRDKKLAVNSPPMYMKADVEQPPVYNKTVYPTFVSDQ